MDLLFKNCSHWEKLWESSEERLVDICFLTVSGGIIEYL
jgi:hypothetical protein